MRAIALSDYIPCLTYFRYFVRREQFFQHESVQQEWLIFAVEDGSFYFEIEGNRATASFGDLVFCPPGVVFRRVVISPVSLFVLRMVWRDDAGNEIDPSELGAIPVGKVSLRHTERLVAGYAAMKRRNEQDEHFITVSRSHYLHHMWMLYCEETEELPGEQSWSQDVSPFIQKAAKLIQSQAFERFSLTAIAASLGTNRMMLSSKFQAELGMTPIKYLTSLRLEKAKQLLIETNLTLDQISECCGYQNGFYLSRVFKNNCGVTPNQYRKEHRL
jgi:AraC-like DNA-binding protein